MRIKKPLQPKKVLSASLTGLQFNESKKVSTQARIDQILLLLAIDKQIHGFKQCLQKFDRLERNNNGLL